MPTKPRILIVAVNPHFVRLFLAEQIRLLVQDGFAVRLVCAPASDGEDLLHDVGCEVEYVAMARSIDPAQDARALLQLRRLMLRWKPDVVHSHAPKAGLLASLAAASCGVTVRLHTIHGLRSEGLRGLRREVMQAMERLTALCCTRCFAVSESLRRMVVEQRICSEQKLGVIGAGSWAGVPTELFEATRHAEAGRALRSLHGIPNDALVVGYIGRIAHDKGVDTLALAWRHLKKRSRRSIWLLVAGPMDETDPVSLLTLAALTNGDRVTFIDRLVDDVPATLAACDIFVQPSFREGLGVAALEASAMELPVVASRVTGLTDAVIEEVTGLLVSPQAPKTLAIALRRLLDRPALRNRLGRQGRPFVEVNFKRSDVLARSLEMYRGIVVPQQETILMKRCLDVLIAVTLLLLTLPLMLVAAIAIALTMGRPVFFRQQRSGLHGCTFELIKFRTMRQPARDQAMIGTDHLRTHWLGDWIRRLSLDELPQLINVLRGEMSLVGPRPLIVDYLPRYNPREMRRHEVKPGITGWAQVNGRNALLWHKKFELDVWYVEHRSLALDLRILWLTFRRLLHTADVTPPGLTSMPEFLGTKEQHST